MQKCSAEVGAAYYSTIIDCVLVYCFISLPSRRFYELSYISFLTFTILLGIIGVI